MSQLNQQRKIHPYWLTVLVGMVLSCLVMNVITIASQLGRFSPWTPLNSPSSGAKRIIDASYRQVWVETQENRFFTAELFFNCEGQFLCWEWKEIDEIPEMSAPYFPVIRGNSCENLQDDLSRPNPDGQVVECVYAHFPGPEFGEEGYFALMADGNILYWHKGSSLIAMQANFVLSTLIVPLIVAGIISAIYLVLHKTHRTSREKAIANQKAG